MSFLVRNVICELKVTCVVCADSSRTFDGPFKSAQSSHSGYLNFFFILFPVLSNLIKKQNQESTCMKSDQKLSDKEMMTETALSALKQ